MNPKTWKEMIDASRNLEASLGTHIKKIEKNEKETFVVQRRSFNTKKNLIKDRLLHIKDIIPLRPRPKKFY